MLDAIKQNFSVTIEKPISPNCEICVVVPVKDEAANIAETLRALINQVDLRGRKLDAARFEIVVLANNCTDETAAIVHRLAHEKFGLPPVHTLEIDFPPSEAHVGRARRTAMDAAFERLTRIRTNGIIATTDGDTTVSANWIAAILREFERGADAVGGRILIADEELHKLDAATRRIHLLAAELEGCLNPLTFDPNPRHHQHFGANFAVTTEFYQRAGRLPIQPFLEDLAFYQALMSVDARFRHSPEARVFTSPRCSGKVEVGLSWQLNNWQKLAANNEKWFVAGADELARKFAATCSLREVWRKFQIAETRLPPSEIKCAAENNFVDSHFLLEQLAHTQTCGEFCEKVCAETDDKINFPKVEIKQAIADLRQKIMLFRTHPNEIVPRAALAAAANRAPSTI